MQITQALLNEIESEACRNDLFEFVKSFWEVIIPDEPVYNWHIPYLCSELQTVGERIKARLPKEHDIIINIPPGTTKSTIATVMFPAWLWIIDPTIKIISSSYSSELSLDHSVKSRDIIKSDKFRRLFPNIKLKQDKDGKKHYGNTNTGMRYATSTGGTVTGMHGHVIIQDDPLNPKQAASAKEIENANTFVDKTLSSRKVNKALTPTITIMQRLHENDVTGHLLKKKDKSIKHICLPAELSKNVQPKEAAKNYVNGLLDPVRLSESVIKEAKTDLGSYGYAGQYDQEPAPSEGGILKKQWFEVVDFPNKKLTWNFTCDPAYTKDESNDPSGIMSYALDGANIYIRYYESVYKEFPDLCKYLESFYNTHGGDNSSMMSVEPKASGKSIVQTLKDATSLNIKESIVPTKDKEARARDVAPRCEAGRVKLIRGSWNEGFLKQLSLFPNAAHDEEVDCLVIAMSEKVHEPSRPKALGKPKKVQKRM